MGIRTLTFIRKERDATVYQIPIIIVKQNWISNLKSQFNFFQAAQVEIVLANFYIDLNLYHPTILIFILPSIIQFKSTFFLSV